MLTRCYKFLRSVMAGLQQPGLTETPRNFAEMATMHPKSPRSQRVQPAAAAKRSVWR